MFRWLLLIAFLTFLAGCGEEVIVPPEIQAKSAQRDSPLLTAVNGNDAAAVGEALKKGADPNLQGERDMPPLHVAASNGNVEIGELLIQHKADVNQLSTFEFERDDGSVEQRVGRTPLHVAVMHNQLDFVELLIQYKADVNATNGHGMTPLDIATGKGQLLVQMEESQSDPKLLTQITSDIATNRSITDALRKQGAQTTEEIEAKKLEDALKEGDGGILGRISEDLEEMKRKRQEEAGPDTPEDTTDPLPEDRPDLGLPNIDSTSLFPLDRKVDADDLLRPAPKP